MYYYCEIKIACRNRFGFIPRPGKRNIIINCCYVNNSIFRKWRRRSPRCRRGPGMRRRQFRSRQTGHQWQRREEAHVCKKRAHRPEGALPRKWPQRGFHGLPGGPAGGLVAVSWVRIRTHPPTIRKVSLMMTRSSS